MISDLNNNVHLNIRPFHNVFIMYVNSQGFLIRKRMRD